MSFISAFISGLKRARYLSHRCGFCLHFVHILLQSNEAVSPRLEIGDKPWHDIGGGREFMEGENVRIDSLLLAVFHLLEYGVCQRRLGASGRMFARAKIVERVHIA